MIKIYKDASGVIRSAMIDNPNINDETVGEGNWCIIEDSLWEETRCYNDNDIVDGVYVPHNIDPIHYWCPCDHTDGYCPYGYDIPEGAITVKPLWAYFDDVARIRDGHRNVHVIVNDVEYFYQTDPEQILHGAVKLNADKYSCDAMQGYVLDKVVNGITHVPWRCDGNTKIFTIQEFSILFKTIQTFVKNVFEHAGELEAQLKILDSNHGDLSEIDLESGWPSIELTKVG